MSFLDNISSSIIDFFRIKEEPEIDPLIDKLRDKGFHFNPDKLWWERTWLVATKTGAESSKEVYIKEDNNWKVVMYGNDGDIFFEHTVNPTDS